MKSGKTFSVNADDQETARQIKDSFLRYLDGRQEKTYISISGNWNSTHIALSEVEAIVEWKAGTRGN